MGGSAICIGQAVRGTECKVVSVEPRYLDFKLLRDKKSILPENELHISEFSGDTNPYIEQYELSISAAGLKNTCSYFAGFSDDYYQVFDKRQIDMLFVDGAHTYDAVKLDCRFMDYIPVGGFAVFDDWIISVKKAVDEYMQKAGTKWELMDQVFPRWFKRVA